MMPDDTTPKEPDSDEFRVWKRKHEAEGREVRFHDSGEEGETIWLAWDGEEWCDIYFDRNGARVPLGVMEVD